MLESFKSGEKPVEHDKQRSRIKYSPFTLAQDQLMKTRFLNRIELN
jgi:hypothetical protein